jgi:hypothetical protein
MQRRSFLKAVLVSITTARLYCASEEAHASENTLEAISTPNPCPVNKPRHGHVEKYPFVWYYRTEVHNHLKVPLRIVSFSCYTWVDGQWKLMHNVLKRPLGTKDFVAWYSDGDVPHDGWIAPGKTAVCDPNWTHNNTGSGSKCKWVYQAEDTHGQKYQAEAVVTLQGAEVRRQVNHQPKQGAK